MEHYAEVRDFLYRRMRGTGSAFGKGAAATSAAPSSSTAVRGGEAEMVRLLRGIKEDIEGVRRALESRGGVD
jgi:hypothetical protein